MNTILRAEFFTSNMTPLLSVCVRTYNQEHFVSDALESILRQKTSFDYEILVSDDYSSDKTQSILSDYKQRYPDRIKLILGDNNIGGPNNLRRVIEASSSKYLAFLDGDDYYIDDYKLQKQIEFLESHSDFAACFHNVVDIDERQNGRRSLFLPLDFPEKHDCVSVISNDWFLPIHSVVLRREFVSFPEWYDTVMNDDFVVNLSVVMHGPYHYMPEIMAVYRHHNGNISNNYSDQILIDSQLRRILVGFRSIYPEQYRSVFDERIKFYDERIAFNTREAKQPWRKFFRAKTYIRAIKAFINRYYHSL